MHRLSNHLGPFFNLLNLILKEEKTVLNETQTVIRHQAKEILHTFERQSLDNGVDAVVVSQAKYALTAFIDEWMSQRLETLSTLWLTHPLQLEFFGEVTAGARFFDYLNAMRIEAHRCIEGLEIYYICLELGYQGQYRRQDKMILLQLKQALFNQIQQVRSSPEKSLSVGASAALPLPQHLPTAERYKRFIVALLALISLVVIGFKGIIYYQAWQVQKTVVRYQHLLKATEAQ